MRILRLRADGFGALRGEFHFATDRLNLVIDENERGKSTLFAAVCAALYGLDDNRNRHRLLTPLERWRPWSGSPYRVELEVEGSRGRLTIMRDFEAGTIAVWNDRGQEITDQFREAREDYPVGNRLLGLDEDQFRKCCHFRQGELEQVIPDDEPERRNTTLRDRLENAADTRVGDTSATEAIRALDRAAASYTCPELDSTLRLDTALSRLETKKKALEVDCGQLEHDLDPMAPRLDRLATLTDEEQRARRMIAELELERRLARAIEGRKRLDLDANRRADLARLRDEAVALLPFARVPFDVESRFGAALARRDAMASQREDLAAKRAENDRERERMRAEIEPLEPYARYQEEDASALASHAVHLRMIGVQRERLRTELDRAKRSAAERGLDLERLERSSAYFDSLPEERARLLEAQPALELRFQSQAAEIEQARSASHETLRRIDAARHRRRLPGWIALASGLVLAGIALAIGGSGSDLPWSAAAIGGATLSLAGLVVVAAAARTRRTQRDEANERLAEADHAAERLRLLKTENLSSLRALADALGHADPSSLHAEWNTHQRLLEASGPDRAIGRRLVELEAQWDEAHAEAARLLGTADRGPIDPDSLDHAAASIRRRLATLDRLAEVDRNRAWIEHDTAAAATALEEIEAEGARLLESAGLASDPALRWDELGSDLAERVRSRHRHEVLTRDLIPEAERALEDPDTLAALRDELARFESDPIRPDAAHAKTRPIAEIEDHLERERSAQEDRRHERNELRIEYEQRARESLGRLAALRAEAEAVERALERARRYKAALMLARATIEEVAFDTHRRWADFLSRRVTEIVRRIGAGIDQLRFGEDLDFAVKLADGPQLSRGKALLQLSSGARDQLHLAIRLAIGEFLSRDLGPLPLLLDDSFATSDDERARAGMRILIEHIAAEHQVIVVTCQRARHEAFASLDRELYEKRVHRIETRVALAE